MPTVARPVPPNVVGRIAVETIFFEASRVSIVEAVRPERLTVPEAVRLAINVVPVSVGAAERTLLPVPVFVTEVICFEAFTDRAELAV